MRTLFKIKEKFRRPVIAIGVFDGVHFGHRIIIKEAVRKARAINGTSIVLTFWPHPHNENIIYSLKHRLKIFSELGVDICIVLRFDKIFSAIPAEEFLRRILVKKINPEFVFIGSNFRFGKDGKGDIRLLLQMADLLGYKVRVFPVIKKKNRVVSSTFIRKLISKGELNLAKQMLVRPVSILGDVIKGANLATKLGFPTANINPHHEVVPPAGVYAVKIILENKGFLGICYIGTRPTFDRSKTRSVEVHIFDFKKNIYKKELEIQFIRKIRDEEKFSSQDKLIKQINKDISCIKKSRS